MADNWRDKLKKALFGKPAVTASQAKTKNSANTEALTGDPVQRSQDLSSAEKMERERAQPASKTKEASRSSTSAAPIKSSIVLDPQSSGTRISGSPPVDAYIGIDFGTRFTKVALHLPHVDLRTIVALGDRAERLLPSKLAVGSDSLVYPPEIVPASISEEFEYLKMRLAEPGGTTFGPTPRLSGPKAHLCVKALSAFFVASVIRMAQRASRKDPKLGISRPVSWLVNVGVPVQHCDSRAKSIFEEMCAVAWLWKDEEARPADLNEIVAKYEASVGLLAGAWDSLPIRVVPELTAALAHFGEDRNTAPGLYAFLDIGGGTLDGSAFLLKRGPDGSEFNIYAAEVDSLGTMAVAQHTLRRMGQGQSTGKQHQSTLERLEKQIILGGKSPLVSMSEIERKVQVLLHKVVAGTRSKYPNLHFSDDFYTPVPRLRALANPTHPTIPIFLAGGGARSNWYQELFRRTCKDFNQHQYGVGGYEVRLLPRPPGTNDDDYPRFVIALGLTSRRLGWDPYQLPSETPDPPKPPEWRPPGGGAPISKDML